MDDLLKPLYGLLGLTPDEANKLEDARKAAKLDPPPQPAKSGGFLSGIW